MGGTGTRIASEPRQVSHPLASSDKQLSDSMKKRESDKIRMQKMRREEETEIR